MNLPHVPLLSKLFGDVQPLQPSYVQSICESLVDHKPISGAGMVGFWRLLCPKLKIWLSSFKRVFIDSNLGNLPSDGYLRYYIYIVMSIERVKLKYLEERWAHHIKPFSIHLRDSPSQLEDFTFNCVP